MKKGIIGFLSVIFVFCLAGCGKQEDFDIGISVPADSAGKFVFSHEEISPKGKKIKVSCDEGLGDTSIVLKAENISPTGMTLTCSQSGGTVVGELYTGTWYILERRTKKDGWKEVAYATTDEIGWEEVAWVVPLDNTVQWEVDWEWLYGTLPDGTYRIGKEFTGSSGDGKNYKEVFYAEFEIA